MSAGNRKNTKGIQFRLRYVGINIKWDPDFSKILMTLQTKRPFPRHSPTLILWLGFLEPPKFSACYSQSFETLHVESLILLRIF